MSGAYDDGYDPELGSTGSGRDIAGNPLTQAGYRGSPQMLQVEQYPSMMSFAGSMNRSRSGDQASESGLEGSPGAGYYNEPSLYSGSIWNHQTGSWVMNPDTTYSEAIRQLYASGSPMISEAELNDGGIARSQSIATTIVSSTPISGPISRNHPHTIPDSSLLHRSPSGCGDDEETGDGAVETGSTELLTSVVSVQNASRPSIDGKGLAAKASQRALRSSAT
ncbi:hypothetical protein BGX31_000961 [Mortierella sp. GBA43]|nr:hypothetical protein BGX31_000961 [Mortierella sp. GBA43]